MRIVMLCDFFNESLEYQENLLLKYYRKHGHEITVIASTFESVFDYYADRHDKNRPKRDYVHDGARIIKLPYRYNILNRLRAYTPIRSILDEARPDLIFVHDIMLNLPECVAYMKRHPETRMIMDYHADYSNSGKNWLSIKILHGVIRKWFLDRARPYLSKIFPIVPAGVQFLREVYKVPSTEMELLPLGTDLEFGRSVQARKLGNAIRAELGIQPNDLVIFTGGKLTPLKKTEHLIDAFLQFDRSDCHLIVAGDVSPEDATYGVSLRERAADCPRIHFRGWLGKEAMYAHMDAADLAIFPASQSVLWQQSLGMGLPLIVSDRSDLVKGHQDVAYLNRHENLILLEPGKPLSGQIAEHLAALHHDRARLARMSEGARRTASEILDWDRLIELTLQFNEPGRDPAPSQDAASAHAA
jgi:1,2-diacylglycerol 3-alpha-glucosyltransferase